MGRLMGQYFANSPLLLLPIISMILFCAAFVFVLLTVATKKKPELTATAALPLGEGEEHSRPERRAQ